MSYNRRQPRQGVRYGPPRERELRSENGIIVGRLLGLAVLLLTLGVLSAGALAFLDDRLGPAGVTSRATTAATMTSPWSTASTPPPTATPAPPVVAPPTATPVPVAPTVLVTPVPTGLPPTVQVGPGFVTFGTRADRQLRIVDPAASFPVDERIVWSAFLTQPANSADLRVQVFKVDGTPPTGERLVLDKAVTPVVSGGQIYQRRIRPSNALDGPGVYVVRYVRGTEILSEGSLEITN